LVKIGDTLAVAIPADVAVALNLHEGDAVEVRRTVPDADDARRAEAIAEIRALARPLSADYRFDREEAIAC
jgi:antitoxin MazE